MMDRRTACALFAAFGCGAGLAQGGSVRWKLATGYRADSFHGQNLAQMAAEAAQAGGPQITLHANGSLVRLADIPNAVRSGSAEMGEVIMTGLVGEMPIAGADALPFVVRSYADARRLWQHQRPLVEAAFESKGLRVLLAVPWPPQGLYAKRPIERAADLAGTRMRTYNSTTERLAQLVGATAVDVPMTKVGEAFAEGRIDCMLTSAVTGVENEVWRHATHFIEVNAWFPKNICFVNAAALQALPAGSREALLNAAAAAEPRGWSASEKVADAAVQELRRRGMRVERGSSQLLGDFKRLGEKFSLEWVREVGSQATRIFIPYFAQQ